MQPSLTDQVFRVIQDWHSSNGYAMWPVDDLETKRKTVEHYCDSGNISPLVDRQGLLEGFCLFYRSWQHDGLNLLQRHDGGQYLVAEIIWIRPDLRGTGKLKELIRFALKQQRERILGAEKLVMHRTHNNLKPCFYDFGKFYRRHTWQKAAAEQHSSSK